MFHPVQIFSSDGFMPHERHDLASIFQVVINTLEEQLPLDFGCICLYEAPDTHLTVTRLGGHTLEFATTLGIAEHSRIEIDHNGLSRCVGGELMHEPCLQEVPCPFPQKLFAGGLQSRLHSALQSAYEDLRQTQDAVMRQEKLRVLGQLASGIAHDINNALSPATLYVESLLERDSGLGGEARDRLLIVKRAIEGIAHTVARMKEFYSQRDSQSSHVPVNLNRVIEQVIELTRARWSTIPQESGVVVQVETFLAADLPDIPGQESDLRDAFTNLVLNAVDAMPSGGRLTFRSRMIDSHRAQVEVVDTGTGMDEATRSRCLELFFTTKGERGTGLGLAMVYGMVERHSGELQIESQPGLGTTTDLGMPHVDGRTVAAEIKSGAPDVPVIMLTGWGHRLLADKDLPPHVNRVLGKPPRLAALRAALAEVTSGAAT
jgi:signal transduction histidine kinase